MWGEEQKTNMKDDLNEGSRRLDKELKPANYFS